MIKKLSLILLLSCLTQIQSVPGNKGACATGKYTDVNLEINKYLGKWFSLFVSASFSHTKPTDKCVFANYLFNSDGTINIHNEALDNSGNIREASAIGYISAPGHLKIRFSTF